MVEGGKGRRRTPEEVDVALAALTWAAAGVPAGMELSVSDDGDGLVVLECLVDQLREQCLPILLDMLSEAGTDRPAGATASLKMELDNVRPVTLEFGLTDTGPRMVLEWAVPLIRGA